MRLKQISNFFIPLFKKWFLVFISIDKKSSILTSKIPSQSRRFFTSGSWKKWKWNRCNFSTRVRRFCINFCHFSHLSSKMKVHHVFKAKMEAFRERNPQKVKNNQKLLHLAFVFPLQMKSTFLCPQARNLAQTNSLGDISL